MNSRRIFSAFLSVFLLASAGAPLRSQEPLSELLEIQNFLDHDPLDVEALLKQIYDGRTQKSDSVAVKVPKAVPAAKARRPTQKPLRLTEKERLFNRMSRRLILDDHGNPKERKALRKALSTLLDSPSARTLAGEFLKEKKRVKVSFEEIENSPVVMKNGKAEIMGIQGEFYWDDDVPYVVLHKGYLESLKEYEKHEIADTLGHELLGHALRHIRAHKAKIDKTWDVYRNDELNAGLEDWISTAERGIDPDSGYMDRFLENPNQYYADSHLKNATYAELLSLEEMKDPVPVYRERLKRAQKAQAGLSKRKENDQFWKKAVAHFISDHKKDPASFKDLAQDIDRRLNVTLPQEEQDLKEIKSNLLDLIDYYLTEYGLEDIETFKRDSSHPYFQEMEEAVQKRRVYLAGLIENLPEQTEEEESSGGDAPENSSPTVKQVSWKELREMYEQDPHINPEFWMKHELRMSPVLP